VLAVGDATTMLAAAVEDASGLALPVQEAAATTRMQTVSLCIAESYPVGIGALS
jgi:hypothetical protein